MDWETPPEVFEPLDAEFHFTLDVCATAENAKCARYFTEEEDENRAGLGRGLLDEPAVWNRDREVDEEGV